ncbi:hypothetical protein AVO42_11875 [Thiomicrospira sp. XS5]|uniref:potassium channel family protein n=1 Tax=Thiomicrospira sp. XS5 TaxID=1775636 RepID=UPI000748A37D|nr:potassium channel family protein [Thiomicrospira sp. XS5]KUJ73515.1 hypothetical protein AVO42_11875 [Thiomicrospira sp. XS5]
MLRKITGQKPIVYGVIYFSLIPIFALVYGLLPSENLNIGTHSNSLFTYVYFSTVTITTLGYGDVLPVGSLTQMLTALESVLGIVFIGLFLNALSQRLGMEVQKTEREAEERRQLLSDVKRFEAYSKLIDMHITRYIRYTIPVTSQISDRKDEELNEDFSFNDMQDMFMPTLSLRDHGFTPAVNFYFSEYKSLGSVVEDAIKHGYLHRWKDLEDICLDFLKISKELDASSYIINQPNIRIGKQKGSEFDMEMIKKHSGEVKYIPGNGINPYVSMFKQIKLNIVFIKNYRILASKIKKANGVF